MGFDGSLLFLPCLLADEDLLDVAGEVEARHLTLLVVDEASGPETLRDAFARYTVITAWGPDPFRAWDRLAAALGARVGGRALALSVGEHGGVGCWQIIDDGAPGPAHWLDAGYDQAPALGFA